MCTDEPEIENVTVVGRVRPEEQHVGFGFDLPPPLGYEVPHLMQLYAAWLRVASGCSHPVLVAFEAAGDGLEFIRVGGLTLLLILGKIGHSTHLR